MLDPVLAAHPHWESFEHSGAGLCGTLRPLPELFPEEERSKQPSAFSVIRALMTEFKHPLAARLAFVGAFGYDLLLQFDPIEQKLPRQDVKDLHLYLCDDIYFMDRKTERIERYRYDFAKGADRWEPSDAKGWKVIDAKDGKVAWRFDVVPATGPARATWPNADRYPVTGGAFWTSFTLDAERALHTALMAAPRRAAASAAAMPAQPPPQTSTSVLSVLVPSNLPVGCAASPEPANEARLVAVAAAWTNWRRFALRGVRGFMPKSP